MKLKLFLNISGVLVFLLVWEIVTRLKLINPIFLSSPTQILLKDLDLFVSGKIYPHLFISAQELFLGFTIALFLGITLGLLMGWYKKFEDLTSSLTYGLYSTPNVALLPLIIIWVGLGIWPKVIIVFLGSFFPILLNTISGVKNLDPNWIMLARSFKATDRQIFQTIILPASLPFILAGIRLAIPRAIIGVIIGEFFVSNKGLGYLITFYGSTFQTTELLAVVLIVITLSISMRSIVIILQKRFRSWKT